MRGPKRFERAGRGGEVEVDTQQPTYNPTYDASSVKVRLYFAAGSTTGWTKRFEYSYNKL